MSSINVRKFNKVVDMVAATDLNVGDTCNTLGYENPGDGGGAWYTVVVREENETNIDPLDILLVSKGTNNESLVARIISTKTVRTFNTVEEMSNAVYLCENDICETLGYYEAGDGGGAKYTVTAGEASECNDMSIISLVSKGANNENLVARFMDEGKPVNVLQFGAKNTYKYFNDRNILPRNDSTAIQAAIDYTNEKLFANVGSYNTENVMRIVIPGGHYFIQDQIWMPPYMQMQLDGNVLFDSFVDARNEELYRYDAETNEFIKIEDIKDDNGEIVRTADSQIFE